MKTDIPLGFSLRLWFDDACNELVNYFDRMDTTHWMVISACAVFFGFLCLRGTSLK